MTIVAVYEEKLWAIYSGVFICFWIPREYKTSEWRNENEMPYVRMHTLEFEK